MGILNKSFHKNGNDDNAVFKTFRANKIKQNCYLWKFKKGTEAFTIAVESNTNNDNAADKWQAKFCEDVKSTDDVEMWIQFPDDISTSVLEAANAYKPRNNFRRRLAALADRFERVREYQSGNISDSLTV